MKRSARWSSQGESVVQLLTQNVEEPGARQMACDDMTVHLTYYTDPLCSWSWAFEPVRTRVADAYSGSVEWTVCMGGLLPDWRSLRDPLNAVQTPAQLAPLWFHVGRVTGVRIDPYVWHTDAPSSSYPACIAVKAAALQGAHAGTSYLDAARTAVMIHRRNIARADVLLAIAKELAVDGLLDFRRFAADLYGHAARTAFADDLRECRRQDVGRFPTFVMKGPHGRRLVVGYRPFELFVEALRAVGGDPDSKNALRRPASE